MGRSRSPTNFVNKSRFANCVAEGRAVRFRPFAVCQRIIPNVRFPPTADIRPLTASSMRVSSDAPPFNLKQRVLAEMANSSPITQCFPLEHQRKTPARGAGFLKLLVTETPVQAQKWLKTSSVKGLVSTNFWGMVPRGGVEPPTRRFSVVCSTTELPGRTDRTEGPVERGAL